MAISPGLPQAIHRVLSIVQVVGACQSSIVSAWDLLRAENPELRVSGRMSKVVMLRYAVLLFRAER